MQGRRCRGGHDCPVDTQGHNRAVGQGCARAAGHTARSQRVACAAMTDLADALDLSLEVGELIQLSGGHTTRTIDSMERMAAALGAQESHVAISSVNVAITVVAGDDKATAGRHAGHFGINFSTLTQIERLVTETEVNQLAPAQVRSRLTLIRNAGRVYPVWLVMLALGGSSAAFAFLFGASPTAASLALLGGWAGAWVRHLLVTRRLKPFVSVSSAAFVSALIVAGRGRGPGPGGGPDPRSCRIDPLRRARGADAQRDRRPADRPLPERGGQAGHERGDHRRRRGRTVGRRQPVRDSCHELVRLAVGRSGCARLRDGLLGTAPDTARDRASSPSAPTSYAASASNGAPPCPRPASWRPSWWALPR